MNDDQTLPDSFPLAWRLPQPANGGKRRVPPRVPPQIPCLACFGPAFSNLRASSTAGSSAGSEAVATAAVTERVQSCPWMRTIGQRPSDARSVQSSQRYLVPCAAQMRDARSIDPLCVSVVELSIAVRESGAEPIDQLGRVICGLAAPQLNATDDAHELARATYEALATVPNLVDALRSGVATADVAAILAAAAAAHDARVNGEGQSNRVVFRTALRRIHSAGELLQQASAALGSSIASIASIQRPAWTVLYDAPDALDGDCDEWMMPVGALIALGGRSPVLMEATPSAETPGSAPPLARQQCCFVATMEGLVVGRTSANGRRTWGLSDALIPCNAVPIRTRHYVEYLGAVAAYANRCIERLSSATSREECCAWALVALADATRGFAQMIREWARMRAHEPPATERARWVVARALLGQRGLDVGALAACLGAGGRDATFNRRIAAFCVATRTPAGIALLVHDRALAAGVVGPTTASVSSDDDERDDNDWDAIDCLSHSPSGTLEFGVYETGWSEWSAGNATDDGGPHDEHYSTNVADVVGCEISRVLVELADAARAHSDVGRRRLTSILRLSLLPDNLLGRHWKYAIENVQSNLECALAASSHGGQVGRLVRSVRSVRSVRVDEAGVGVGVDMALKAAVFRRRCIRALHDASRYPLHDTLNGAQGRRRAALATWLTNESGDGVVFARAFHDIPPLAAELMVIEYERAMRRSLAAFDRKGHAPTASLVTNTARTARGIRVARLGVQGVVFVDDASDAAFAGSGNGRFLEYCSSNAVLAADDCAVSVVHWPQTSL